MTDKDYMRIALDLAERGRLTARPNPMVGAVAVHDGRIVGKGYHHEPGQPHAEVHALSTVQPGLDNVAVYATLEPCSFTGRTPPCSDFLIDRGVKRVVCAMVDPDKRVSGKGIQRLRDAGVETEVGVLEADAKHLNAAYLKHRETGFPYVTLKLAQSLDGSIATRTGDSKWITGEAARTKAHALRAEAQVVVVGVGTILADDPQLNVRKVKGQDPVKVVFDSTLRTPSGARVHSGAPLVLATGAVVDPERRRSAEEAGAEVWVTKRRDTPSAREVLRLLAERDVIHVLVEGGSRIAASFLKERLVDRIVTFIAPKVIGDGVPSVGSLEFDGVADAVILVGPTVEWLGDDVVYTADVTYGDGKG